MNKIYSKVFALTAAMLAVFGFTAAQAASFDWGVHDGASKFGVGVIWSSGSFLDTYSFSIGDNLVLNTSVTVSNNNPPPTQITDGVYSLFSNPDGIVNNSDDTTIRSFTFNGTTGSTPNSLIVTAGNYYFAVSGNATGTGTPAGIYTITSTVAPVPEPEIYAMLAAGLGFMGFVARRRKQREATIA